MVSGAHEPRRISGILDWEQCGWYPAYWEYCKFRMYEHEWRMTHWVDLVLGGDEMVFEVVAQYWNWRSP